MTDAIAQALLPDLPVDNCDVNSSEIAFRKRQDRENILSQYASWRLPGAPVPAPEDDPTGVFDDVSSLPLLLLTDLERYIVKSDATALAQRLGAPRFCSCALVSKLMSVPTRRDEQL